MRALLLAAHDLIAEELIWPDDFNEADMMSTALMALGTYYDAVGTRIIARSHYPIAPSEIRVIAHDGTEIHRWTVSDLAKSLGKENP